MIKEKITSLWVKIKTWFKEHLVDEAHEWWMLWSTRLNGAGLALQTWIQIDPAGVLGVWQMMPDSLKTIVPSNIFQLIAIILFVLGMLLRFVKQPKVEKKSELRKQL